MATANDGYVPGVPPQRSDHDRSGQARKMVVVVSSIVLVAGALALPYYWCYRLQSELRDLHAWLERYESDLTKSKEISQKNPESFWKNLDSLTDTSLADLAKHVNDILNWKPLAENEVAGLAQTIRELRKAVDEKVDLPVARDLYKQMSECAGKITEHTDKLNTLAAKVDSLEGEITSNPCFAQLLLGPDSCRILSTLDKAGLGELTDPRRNTTVDLRPLLQKMVDAIPSDSMSLVEFRKYLEGLLVADDLQNVEKEQLITNICHKLFDAVAGEQLSARIRSISLETADKVAIEVATQVAKQVAATESRACIDALEQQLREALKRDTIQGMEQGPEKGARSIPLHQTSPSNEPLYGALNSDPVQPNDDQEQQQPKDHQERQTNGLYAVLKQIATKSATEVLAAFKNREYNPKIEALERQIGELADQVAELRQLSQRQYSPQPTPSEARCTGLDKQNWRVAIDAVRHELLDKLEDLRKNNGRLTDDQIRVLASKVTVEVLSYLAQYGIKVPVQSEPPSNPSGTVAPVTPMSLNTPAAGLPSYAFSEGVRALRQSDADRAIALLMEAVQVDARNPVYRYYLAVALRRAGREDEARAQVAAGCALEKHNAIPSLGPYLERLQGSDRLWLEHVRLGL